LAVDPGRNLSDRVMLARTLASASSSPVKPDTIQVPAHVQGNSETQPRPVQPVAIAMQEKGWRLGCR